MKSRAPPHCVNSPVRKMQRAHLVASTRHMCTRALVHVRVKPSTVGPNPTEPLATGLHNCRPRPRLMRGLAKALSQAGTIARRPRPRWLHTYCSDTCIALEHCPKTSKSSLSSLSCLPPFRSGPLVLHPTSFPFLPPSLPFRSPSSAPQFDSTGPRHHRHDERLTPSQVSYRNGLDHLP